MGNGIPNEMIEKIKQLAKRDKKIIKPEEKNSITILCIGITIKEEVLAYRFSEEILINIDQKYFALRLSHLNSLRKQKWQSTRLSQIMHLITVTLINL